MNIQIEKGVPIPDRHHSFTHGMTGAIRSMAIGDSFVIPKEQRTSVINCSRASGAKLSVRKISDTEVRVWRVA